MNKLNKRSNRSDSYQNLYLETSFSNDMLDIFSNEDSISSRLNPFSYDERLLDLEEPLKVEFWRVADEHLTERQKKVMRLSSEGKTQMEIAKLLNVNQSSITKCIFGNVSYLNNGKTIYGGIKKKLLKVIETDEKIKDILNQMSSIRTSKW
jgi:hypothetical protein